MLHSRPRGQGLILQQGRKETNLINLGSEVDPAENWHQENSGKVKAANMLQTK